MSLSVEPLCTARDRREFIRFPFRLYAGDPRWVPPLIRDVKEKLDRGRHPFFRHGEAEFYLARRGGRVVGRIAALIDRQWNAAHSEKAAGFGLIEFEQDPEVAAALVRTAARYGADRGMEVLRGPFNYSNNEECGTLIRGFERPPVVMMPYNPPYYPEFFEQLGLGKAIDLYAYYLDDSQDLSRVHRIANLAARRHKLTIREIDLKSFDAECELIRRIFNEAWSDNWGYSELSAAEFRWHAAKMRPVLESRLTLVVERDGGPIGFIISIPDYNQALIHLGGRLFPLGIFKLLWHRRRIDGIRTILMGVLPRHRNLGAEALLCSRTIENGLKLGYRWVEISWVLENNTPMRNLADRIGAFAYKQYRIWEAPI